MLGVPTLTQVVVGPLVQRALFAHLHLLIRIAKSFTCAGKVAQDDSAQLADDAHAATPVTSDSLKTSDSLRDSLVFVPDATKESRQRVRFVGDLATSGVWGG